MYYPRNVDLKEMPLPWRHEGKRQVDYRGITRQLKRLYYQGRQDTEGSKKGSLTWAGMKGW